MVRGSLDIKIDARKPLLDTKMKAGVGTSKLKWQNRDARKPLLDTKMKAGVGTSKLKWQMREKLGKASKKE